MKFTKMNGLCNDYIFINVDNEHIENPSLLARKLTDVHKCIGGDGIVLLGKDSNCDLFMRIYNADGSEGLMCGNALRCLGKYAYENLGVKKDKYRIATQSGIKTVEVKTANNKVVCATADLGEITELNGSLCFFFDNKKIEGYYVSVGNPHFVFFVDEFPSNLAEIGKHISEHKVFTEGANVEFVLKKINNSIVTARVYERGTGETLACGTGAGACFYVCRKKELVPDEATIHFPGGDINCIYDNGHYKISGVVEKNFEGEIEI